jgi:hypothetical protein
MTELKPNEFFDINKLPPEKGLLLFGLSMNKLFNRQNPENCLEDIRNFSPSKITKPLVGLDLIYTDFLYLYSHKPAPELKNSFMNQVITHRNGVCNLVGKNNIEFQIQHAFNFLVWNQLYVGTNDFNELFNKVKKIYENDELFQKYINEDCLAFGREMEDNQVNFFLEEILMMYLLTKNKIKLPNEYIEGNQKWILWCYPGRPLKSTVYFYKLNPFKLSWPENSFEEAHYDLESKKLIVFSRVDLDTYEVR